jgi:hypothetical protein
MVANPADLFMAQNIQTSVVRKHNFGSTCLAAHLSPRPLTGRLPALHDVDAAGQTPSTTVPVCRVGPDLSVRSGRDSGMSQP